MTDHSRPVPNRLRARLPAACVCVALALGGCSPAYQADGRLLSLIAQAEFGEARALVHEQGREGGEREVLLDATKRGMLALADGLPEAADRDFEVVFDVLRTQGLNDDRTTESIFVNEQGTRIWKGEPFEQAMAYTAIALADASRGDWGNARAAAANALFQLREYGDVSGETVEYRAVPSTFALGYLIQGIASLEMGRREEAEELFASAVASRPALAPTVDSLLAGEYDTVLVIDYGLGPRREAVESGGVAIRYVPRTLSDGALARVTIDDRLVEFPQAADVNAMSRDVRWQSRESIRRFKRGLGEGLMLGGAVLATTGGTRGDDDIARLAIGAGLVTLGAISQVNARADTRHNEVLPQRVYVAPIRLDGWTGPVRVEIPGRRGGRMTLHGLHLREPGEHVLRYVRLPSTGVSWSEAPRILYGNDATGPLRDPTLPYILGGHDVRFPDESAAEDYERAGLDVGGIGDTLGEVRELYRREGIRLFRPGEARDATGHLLEGGHTLYTPLPGTTGFSRLFARPHAPYATQPQASGRFIGGVPPQATE